MYPKVSPTMVPRTSLAVAKESLAALGGAGVGAVGVGGVAGHEDRPAHEPDDLHDGGGDADWHGDAHGAIRRETSDADGDGGEQRGGEGQDEEPGGDSASVSRGTW